MLIEQHTAELYICSAGEGKHAATFTKDSVPTPNADAAKPRKESGRD
jgi:hypothetical protein